MDVRTLCCNNGGSGFYPTPKEVARRMLGKVKFKGVYHVLEPSAGKGDLAVEILKTMNEKRKFTNWTLELVEIDPNLRGILKNLFTEEGIKESESKLLEELDQIKKMGNEKYDNPEVLNRYVELSNEAAKLDNTDLVRVVHDDFLTYSPAFGYDLIVMNPPFDRGAAHLLHAVSILQYMGGQIVCLLNAETIRNPYSQERKDLEKVLEKYDAEVEYLPGAFLHAERQTDVEAAIVYINIQRQEMKSRIFDRLEKAQEEKLKQDNDYAELVSSDPIEAAIAMYNMEVTASRELITEFWAMERYLNKAFNGKNKVVLELAIAKGGAQIKNFSVEDYLKGVRMKYWEALLENKQFIGLLTSKLQSKYRNMLNELADYEFSRYNIDRVKTEMMSELVSGAKECIMELFDKLTVYHAFNDSVENGNVHYYNGWKTNKAYKLDRKCIIPGYSIWSQWGNHFDMYAIYALLSDMEKALNYLDGGMTQQVDLESTLKAALDADKTRNIPFKYFDISLYKKGTVHITFRCQELFDRFNIFAAQNRGWLPPAYGKAKYEEMSREEQEVIDSFQGKEEYAKVLAQPQKYLFSEKQILMLPGQESEMTA
ncbi:DUF4942 domain-containing protein [Ruminococcus sp. CLA-AA-H200]|uniref:DUF4942 domain-containing protein n=1 Tax=Ruminococcus turbiniformis TaxID=2881258 RepID=A0ABS8FZV8_9FIRM|nr:DUF4942 domain-containing protein [Ruminococcus turbiniformis]MCC2255551.1 DUF4942 domain-containing protein [Ruminococcus turbiniformis]